MPFPAPDTLAAPGQSASATSRRADTPPLVLTELNFLQVIDCVPEDGVPQEVMTFGTVREPCPKCQQGGLKLILRQSSVRVAHLFCADCATCYDAQYPDGAPALTI
jgi:hypothetical protein